MWDEDKRLNFKRKFDCVEVQSLKNELDNLKESISQDAIDTFCQSLNSVILEAGKRVGAVTEKKINPRSEGGKRRKPLKPKKDNQDFWDNECDQIRALFLKKKNRLSAQKTKNKGEIDTLASQYKSDIKRRKRLFRKEFNNKLKNLKSTDPKQYWSIINRDPQGKHCHEKLVLDTFSEHFKKLANKEGVGHEGPEHSDVTDVNLNEPFTVEEVRIIIKNLKRNKAGGADFLKNEMLINCPDDLLPLFTDFFNIVLESGLIPEDWCLGIIMPLHKDGPRANPDNYRGITLLSCLGKVFTALLNKRLKAYIDTQGGLSEAQAGFRDGYSTIDHIFSLHMLIKLYTSRKGKKLYCAFVDFKKAFDLVDRSKLWRKMIEGGMSGRVLLIIQNVYKRAKLSVRLNGTLSQSFTSNIGVLQGEILSPILFAFFLNDFEPYLAQQYPGASVDPDKNAKNIKDEELDTFLKLYVLLYADDSILLAESAEALQDALHEYCLLNEIIVNTDQSKEKTKIIVFSRGKIRNKPDFTYGSEPIEIVFEYTYLGIRFNYNGEFDIAIRKRIDLARTAMFGLIQKANRLGLTVDTQIELFEKTVLPIALYGCEVWGASNLKQLESFQSQFYKYILKLARFTPSCMVLGETGRLNLKSIIRTRMIGYWSRLINGSENKIAYQVYRIAHSKHVNPENSFKSDWLAEINNILRGMNKEDLWAARSFSTDLKLEHKSSRKEAYQEQWLDDIDRDARCGYYAMLTTEPSQEQYMYK